MRALLVNPPMLCGEDIAAEPLPMGLMYLEAAVRERGEWDVGLVNLAPARSWEAVRQALSAERFDCVGIPCFSQQRYSVLELAKVAKQVNPEAFVVLGGPHASFLDREILSRVPEVDAVVRGEGEATFLRLLSALGKPGREGWQDIPGLSFRKAGGEAARNPAAPPIADLDSLPFPALSAQEAARLRACSAFRINFSGLGSSYDAAAAVVPLSSSRGCIAACNFCSNAAFWGRPRFRSSDNILEELRRRRAQFGAPLLVQFCDDNITGDDARFRRICRAVREEKLDLKWWCSSRATGMADPEKLAEAKEAGCFMISFGLESACQRVVDRMGKRIAVDDVRRAVAAVKSTGMLSRVSTTIGNVGEDLESIETTLRFIREVQPDLMSVNIIHVYPGTPMHKMMESKGLLTTDWWFRETQEAPIFTLEHPVERLREYFRVIMDGIAPNIAAKHEDPASAYLFLKW
jgi:anaerobic magnesium-protoporphyrin IX monomethyl ester cyclase